LPNEVYLATDGRAFDGTGIPLEIRASFFSQADLQNGRDAALEEAIKQIKIRKLELRRKEVRSGFPKRTTYGNSGSPIAVDDSLCAHWS